MKRADFYSAKIKIICNTCPFISMIRKDAVPAKNPGKDSFMQGLYTKVFTTKEQRKVTPLHIFSIHQAIEEKFDHIDNSISQKIIQAYTISEYFDYLWNNADIKKEDKDVPISP